MGRSRTDREASSTLGDMSVASVEKMRLDPFISCLSWAIKFSACCLYPKEEWPFLLEVTVGPATTGSLVVPCESISLEVCTAFEISVG